ncbi:DUF7149 domain-containing protein [Helicobacter pylori]
MMSFACISLKDFIKKYNPPTPTKETIENFEKEINSLLENAPRQDDEEFQKNEINKFLGKISNIKERYAYKGAVLKNAFLSSAKLLKHVFLSGIRN